MKKRMTEDFEKGGPKDSYQYVENLKEFIFNLKNKYKKEIIRNYNNSIYKKNKEYYKKLGYNEYLEKDITITKYVLVPKEYPNLIQKGVVSLKHMDSFKDDRCKLFILQGTLTSINDFIIELRNENVYDPNKSLLMDIPMSYYNVIVGRNGIVLYKHEGKYKIKIRIFDKKKEYFTLIVHGDNKNKFKDYVLDIIYEDII